jgi:lipid-binding SYLF domain-containing protein
MEVALMRSKTLFLVPFFLALSFVPALAEQTATTDKHAGKYEDAIQTFRQAGESGEFFQNSYGYAVFPSIGKGGIGIGGAHGGGRVYVSSVYVGDTKMTQVTLGFQLGGQVYSEIIFFQNKEAFDKFTTGKFEFGAQAAAVAITAGASAQAGTGGTGASASGDENHAATAGGYQNGMAVFTIAKGGLMYEASIGGQKFSYKPKKAAAE